MSNIDLFPSCLHSFCHPISHYSTFIRGQSHQFGLSWSLSVTCWLQQYVSMLKACLTDLGYYDVQVRDELVEGAYLKPIVAGDCEGRLSLVCSKTELALAALVIQVWLFLGIGSKTFFLGCKLRFDTCKAVVGTPPPSSKRKKKSSPLGNLTANMRRFTSPSGWIWIARPGCRKFFCVPWSFWIM